MKILKRSIVAKNGSGFLLLEAEEPEDMYHLFNLIGEGDLVTTDTSRNVTAVLSVPRHSLL